MANAIEKMQKEMSYWMLATFAAAFSSTRALDELERIGVERNPSQYQGADLSVMDTEQMEHLLSDTVLKEFKTRLARIGLEYQSPDMP